MGTDELVDRRNGENEPNRCEQNSEEVRLESVAGTFHKLTIALSGAG